MTVNRYRTICLWGLTGVLANGCAMSASDDPAIDPVVEPAASPLRIAEPAPTPFMPVNFGPFIPKPTCPPTVTPTMTVGETDQGFHFDSVSNSGAFSEGCPDWYSAKIAVPGGYSHGWSSNLRIYAGFRDWSALGPAQCNDSTIELTIRKRSRQGSWSPWQTVKSGTFQGTWVPDRPDWPAHCEWGSKELNITAPSPTWMRDEYSVQVRPRISGDTAPSRIGWHWRY